MKNLKNFFIVCIIMIFLSYNESAHNIYTCGNPYQLGVNLLTRFFDYSFKPIQIDNALLPYEMYTLVSVSSQKVVLYTNESRILMFGSNQVCNFLWIFSCQRIIKPNLSKYCQNYPLFDSPATIIDHATATSTKLELNETISRFEIII